MSFIEIYGTKIKLPDVPDKVEDWGTDNPKEQYWRRRDLPSFFEQVEYDREGNAILSQQQREYALEEVRRCKEGFWFMNNGIATYISGKNYFYLMWWKLEDDIYAEYRDTDRRYFLFLNHWENIPWCLGVIRGKKRREGATSQATSNLVYECIFFKNSICGLVSKTDKDGRTAFTNMVAFGYRQLPVFLKPKQLNNKDSVTELVFAHKSVTTKEGKGAAIDSDTGHRSKVDFRAASTNAYDSGRLSRGCWDEGGKWPVETPFSKFIAIVSKTMVKGAKRVGFMECPSTVNEMTKAGGAEFKKVWDSADFKNERTTNRLVRYFTPAYDGYVGFIDRYGFSVIDTPTEDQYKYLVDNYVGAGDLNENDIRCGARDYLVTKRSELEGTELEEEIRMNPFDEKEMFLSAGNGCLYAAQAMRMRTQLDWLSYNDVIERGNLVWENGDDFYSLKEKASGEKELIIGKLKWVPAENGLYQKVKDWFPKEQNNIYERNGFFFPDNNHLIRMACDPFKYDKTKDNRKSNCVSYVYQMEDIFDLNNPYNDMFVMRYGGRASTTDIANEHILKMAWYCGCQVLFERNVDHWKKYFGLAKCAGFLTWLANEVEPGIYTDGQGKVVQLGCNYTESYLEKHTEKIYFKEMLSEETGHLGFEVENTQKYDDAMGANFTLIAVKNKKYMKNDTSKMNVENLMPYRKAI